MEKPPCARGTGGKQLYMFSLMLLKKLVYNLDVALLSYLLTGKVNGKVRNLIGQTSVG